MDGTKNSIGKIKNSNIKTINQANIENQTNYFFINNDDRFMEMTTSHKLFPLYMVDYTKTSDGKYRLYSKPTCKEAELKYPVNYKSSFTVVDERYKNIKDSKLLLDMLQYADSPVEVKINNFEQYLGSELDQYPNPELSPIQGGVKSYITPHKRKLPNIVWNVDMCFDDSDYTLKNIKLKLTKQISSKQFILDNYAQKTKPVQLQLILTVDEKLCNCKLNYQINENKINDSKTKLIYNKLCLNLLLKKYSIVDKNNGKIILSGINKKKNSQKIVDSLKRYISILERIIIIEKYFNIKFNVPNKIGVDDIVTINRLYNYIIDSRRKVKAFNVKFKLLKKNTEITKIKQLVKLPHTSIMNVSKNITFNILGIDIKIREIIERYDNIKCSNIEQITEFIEKFEDLPKEYEIEIQMISANGKYLYKITEIKI